MGALLRRYFGRGIVFSTLSGLALSAAIELTQTTGALGLLPCRYRIGDVDDVILNTTGALIGALAAGVLLFFLPDPRVSVRSRSRARPVTRTRRLVGMLIDAALFTTLPAVLLTAYRVVVTYVLGRPTHSRGRGTTSSPGSWFWSRCSRCGGARVARPARRVARAAVGRPPGLRMVPASCSASAAGRC
ncbi:VanZ family protein [Tessaracoccus sp. HDW20]|uniref:VanZ family protein n=1 Tax=Tessaracoccus coleopterorum TaxID=2714950 RepID=UPI0018D43D28|nr:VanZ family protein [Tessaracoccus coleopterorum]